MNTPNNKRKKESQEKIEKTFLELIQTKEVENISVSDVCKICKLNRSTFYANYIDIYDLVEKIKFRMENEFANIFINDPEAGQNSISYLKMFNHIKENQIFYKTYFKLCYDDRHLITIYDTRRAEQEHIDSNIKYHIEFFRNGLNAIIKLWLAGGCQESPEAMADVLKTEYRGR